MNTFLTMGPIKRAMNDEEGFITSDQIEIELLDSLTVEGRIPDHDNPNLLYSETPIEGSLLNKIFGDKTAKYTVFVSVYKPYPGTAEFTDVETIFIGDVDPNSIPKDHFWISDAETEKEVTMQTARITVNAGSSRLKSFTVKEFINGVQYSTCYIFIPTCFWW